MKKGGVHDIRTACRWMVLAWGVELPSYCLVQSDKFLCYQVPEKMRGFPVSACLLILLWYKNEEFDRCKID